MRPSTETSTESSRSTTRATCSLSRCRLRSVISGPCARRSRGRSKSSPPTSAKAPPCEDNEMTQLDFAVLPFVKVDAAIRFGGFTLWPNMPAQWLQRFKCEPPKLLELYRDREAASRDDDMSILSPDNSANVTFERYR